MNPSKYSTEVRLKKRNFTSNNTEELQKREKIAARLIIVISIIIGILITFVLTGIIDFFTNK
jgi:hypothetical protein